MATTETRQLVRLTNISKQNLGFKSPLKFLLRGKQLDFEERRCTKVIYEDQVDAQMRQWEADGFLTIKPFKTKSETARPPKKEPKKPAKKTPAEGLKGDPKKPGFEDLSGKEKPQNIDLNITDRAEKGKDRVDLMAENPPEPTKGTVASGFDGQPTTGESEKTGTDDDDGDDAVPPTLTEESNVQLPDSGIVYAWEELVNMKMSDLRRVLQSKEIDAKSTAKSVLAQAVLDHQATLEATDAAT